jgi:hypothetical protein
MAFVVYDKETTKIFSRSSYQNYHNTEKGAKAALTRLLKKNPELVGKLAIADGMIFHQNIEKQVYRTNLMSGKTYVEPYNTPSYCSPSSESYWSS